MIPTLHRPGVCVHYLSTPLVFILYVLSRQSSDKARAEFPFPWKHLTLPIPTALLKGTEISRNFLPFSWPFPMPTVSPQPKLHPLSNSVLQWHLNCNTDASRTLNQGLGNSQSYFELLNVKGWEILGSSFFPSGFEFPCWSFWLYLSCLT